MNLGIFSTSLSVKNLAASIVFYEKLGFVNMGSDPEHGYVMLKNGETVLGLFQDMFEGNILTFNPGWDSSAQNVDPFTDVREIHTRLVSAGLEISDTSVTDADEGPAYISLVDPDGNVILIDQHR